MAFARREALLPRLRSYYRWPRSFSGRRNARDTVAAIDLPDRALSRDPDGLGPAERRDIGQNIAVGRPGNATAEKIKTRAAGKIFCAVTAFRFPVQACRLSGFERSPAFYRRVK